MIHCGIQRPNDPLQTISAMEKYQATYPELVSSRRLFFFQKPKLEEFQLHGKHVQSSNTVKGGRSEAEIFNTTTSCGLNTPVGVAATPWGLESSLPLQLCPFTPDAPLTSTTPHTHKHAHTPMHAGRQVAGREIQTPSRCIFTKPNT